MFLHPPCYDLKELAQSNLHIHTTFSGCAKREMELPEILRRAKESGLKRIALTDHSPVQGSFAAQIAQLKEQLAVLETPVAVLFGAELSGYGVGKLSEDAQIRASLDYRLVSYNHYHQEFYEQPKQRDAAGYKAFAKTVLQSLFALGEADCIAHPFIGRFMHTLEDKHDATRIWTDNELGDILQAGTRAQVAWELNTGAILGDPDFFRRYFAIGKETGAVFNLGTDAHRLDGIDTRQYLPELERILL